MKLQPFFKIEKCGFFGQFFTKKLLGLKKPN